MTEVDDSLWCLTRGHATDTGHDVVQGKHLPPDQSDTDQREHQQHECRDGEKRVAEKRGFAKDVGLWHDDAGTPVLEAEILAKEHAAIGQGVGVACAEGAPLAAMLAVDAAEGEANAFSRGEQHPPLRVEDAVILREIAAVGHSQY